MAMYGTKEYWRKMAFVNLSRPAGNSYPLSPVGRVQPVAGVESVSRSRQTGIRQSLLRYYRLSQDLRD